MRKGSTIAEVCHDIHKDLVARFRYALVWVRVDFLCARRHCQIRVQTHGQTHAHASVLGGQGLSVKYYPQRVGVTHELSDEDVVQIAA